MGFGEFFLVELLVFEVLSMMEFFGVGSERVIEGFLDVLGRFKCELLHARYRL